MAELETRLVYSTDESGKKAAIKGLHDIEKSQAQLTAAQNKAAKGANEYAAELRKLAKLDSGARQRTTEIKQETAALEQQKRTFGELADERRRAIDDAGTGFSGDVASSVGGLRGAADALSGGNAGGLGKGLEAIEAVADTFEFLPLLANQMKTVFDAAKTGTGVVGGLASGFTALVPALGATGGAVAAILLPVAALTAAIIPLVIGFQMVQKQAEEYAASLRREADVRQAARDAGREADDALAAGDFQSLVDARQAIFDDLAAQSRAYSEENALLLQQNAEIQEAALFSLPRGARQARDDQKALVEDMGQNITLLTTQIAEYDERLAGLSPAQINAALNAENLAVIEQALAETEQARLSTLSQLEQATARVTALDEQRAGLIAQRAQQETFAAQTEALERQFANEDQAEQNRELYAELETIAANGKAALTQIETEIADLRIERSRAIASVEAQGQAKIGKLNKDYFSKSIADVNKFRKETERIETDTARARLKLIDDINSRLKAAESDNNVIAFLQAQSEGQQQLQDQAETADIAEQRRVEDFVAAQQEAQVAQQERLAEAVAAIEAEKQKVIESFDERRNQLIAARDAEKEAIKQATAEAAARYAETEAREAQAADRQAQRDELREQQNETLFNQQLDAIEQKKQAELAALHAVEAALVAIEARANDFARQQREIETQSEVSNNNSSFNNAPSGTPFTPFSYTIGSNSQAFADGGIVTKPTLALIGERGYPEAVVPMRNRSLSQDLNKYGMGSMSGGGINLTIPITMNNSVGDIATKSMLDNGLAQTLETVLYDALMPLLENALAGKSAA